MDKVDWSKAPEWADRALLNCNDDWLFSDGVRFITTAGGTEYHDRSDGNGGRWLGVDDFKAVKMRPDNWKEGEKRMDQIAQNGNSGEVYDEAEDGKLSAYHRKVKGVWIDFYDIANAFDPENRNSADDHALKKMLLPGKRHTKGGIQDRKEAIQSIERAIELEDDK